MRLIDADTIYYEIIKYFPRAFETTESLVDAWKKLVAEQPTAYDVETVVEQLEECKRIMESPVFRDCYNEECRSGDCTVCAFEKAIEIVKAEFERCRKLESEG